MAPAAMNAAELREAERVSGAVARKFSRTLRVDEGDVRQAAFVAIVGQLRKGAYDPTRGELGAYLYGTAYRAAAIEATRLRSPVSAHHRRDALYECKRVSDEVLGAHAGDDASPELDVARAAAIRAVKKRLVDLLGPTGAEFYLALVDGRTSAQEYAAQRTVSTEAVMDGVARMRDKVKRDPELLRLWQDLDE